MARSKARPDAASDLMVGQPLENVVECLQVASDRDDHAREI
jgi:hypothetical protein